MSEKKFRTEAHEYTDYGSPVDWNDNEIRLGDIFKEVLANFIRFKKGQPLSVCPFFSNLGDCCAFDELSHVLDQSDNQMWAEKVRGLFMELMPLKDGRKIIYACGDDLTCGGLKVEGEPEQRTLIFREIIATNVCNEKEANDE